jgi:hypothetical protein
MVFVALATWVIAAAGGLYLVAVWLIEYDREYQTAAATRLPVPVIGAHALLAVGGLVVWMVYAIGEDRRFAWAAVGTLTTVALLGLTMAFRWVGVRRSQLVGTGTATVTVVMAPPERSFPVSVVVGHGLFAVTTYVLVLITTIRAGRPLPAGRS